MGAIAAKSKKIRLVFYEKINEPEYTGSPKKPVYFRLIYFFFDLIELSCELLKYFSKHVSSVTKSHIYKNKS